MPTIVITRKMLLHTMAGVFIAQGAIGFTLAVTLNRVMDKALYLADIVQRNAEHLDDFDLIALRDLGVLRTVSEDEE